MMGSNGNQNIAKAGVRDVRIVAHTISSREQAQ